MRLISTLWHIVGAACGGGHHHQYELDERHPVKLYRASPTSVATAAVH
jgi:hypothetical protein